MGVRAASLVLGSVDMGYRSQMSTAMSLACPPVRMKSSGFPKASVTA